MALNITLYLRSGSSSPSSTRAPDEIKVFARLGGIRKVLVRLYAFHDLVEDEEFGYAANTTAICHEVD